jgi:hypothetical protein
MRGRGLRVMDAEWETMPLMKLQAEIGRLLAKNRSEDRYLAGGVLPRIVE